MPAPSLRDVARFALLAVLLWAPLARGGGHGWPLAVTHLLTLLAVSAWLWAMLKGGALEWRRTALDGPLGVMFLLILIQLVLGNGSLRAWALAPPTPSPEFTADVPARFWFLGTVTPRHTWQALALFATYVAVYLLVVNLIGERRQLQRFVRTLLVFGAALAFVGLLEYMAGDSWVLRWKEPHGEIRLRATFNNPDHFASWLTMLVCLGVGALAASRPKRREGMPFASLFTSRELREDVARRYLPFLAVVVASLGLVFTLSRGGLMSLFVGLTGMALVFGRLGWMRWGFAVAGAFGAATLVYAVWIGLGPLLARLELDASRWLIARATFPMLSAFPLFGTGLGTYQDIFFRYQTADLKPGQIYFSDAHNDLLQLVVETGALGAVIAGYMAWRVVRDLVVAHLFGRGRCPVGGGEGELAQRHDPFSIGIAVGALGAVLAFCVHCLVDFPTRIPANGVLAAACLGIATVALHTRFDRKAQLLTECRSWSFGGRRLAPVAVGLAAGAVVLAVVPWVIRPARIHAALAHAETPQALDAAVALDPGNPAALALRGSALESRGRQEQRRDLVESAVADFRSTLAAIPSGAFVHERLGWSYELLSTLDPTRASEHAASAVAHLKRGIAMAPENAHFHLSLAAFAATRLGTLQAIGLEASRAAVARDPTLLSDIVDHFEEGRLPDHEWLAAVPATWPDRLELGQLLEASGRVDPAEVVYRAAIDVAPADERPIGIWMLGGLLTRKGQPAVAAREIEQILPGHSRNPELLVAYGHALAAQGNAGALDVYRAAVAQADAMEDQRELPFKSGAQRMRSFVSERVGPEDSSVRHRRALARYLGERGLWSQSGHEWDRVLSRVPTDADAHFARAVVWERAGAADRALEHYRQALTLGAPSSVRLRLARLLWETEQYFQAMNEWRTILESEPDNVEARLGLARAHLKEGDRVAAFNQFQRVLRIEPDQPDARREMARLTGRQR
jgi:tetratricopeptide (TPR) repeat protein